MNRDRGAYQGSDEAPTGSASGSPGASTSPQQPPPNGQTNPSGLARNPVGDSFSSESISTNVRSACTQLCSDNTKSRVCSKTLLVDIRHAGSADVLRGLCILDEQSNASFCDMKFIQYLGPPVVHEDYTLSTMNGSIKVSGYSVSGLEVKGVQEEDFYQLPPLLSHPELPDTSEEAATRDIVKAHSHISRFKDYFPPTNEGYEVLLLVGANCGELMRSNSYGSRSPFVHHTPLGYAVVGPVCNPELRRNGENKIMVNCTTAREGAHYQPTIVSRRFTPDYSKLKLESPFQTRDDDDLTGMSQEDIQFLDIISNGIIVNEKGNLQMPLPLKPNAEIPNNKNQVFYRTKNTLARLKRNPAKLQSSLKTFGEYLAAGHVEEVPRNRPDPDLKCYLSIFPIYNTKKEKTRLVLDPSATTNGKSLNDALLQGPDETNSLVGILMRFRLGEIGFSTDIKKMFHSFYVNEEHRGLFTFFWFANNDPQKEIVEFRSNVMIFGSKCSPSCATYALRYAAQLGDPTQHAKARSFIARDVYVDDGLGSSDKVSEAVEVLTGSKELLSKYNIELCQFASSSQEVLNALPQSELAEVCVSPDVSRNRTLGLMWDPAKDTLALDPDIPDRPFTKRGILAVINSVYDPLGLVSPSLLSGKLFQREILLQKCKNDPNSEQYDWDDPLPPHKAREWRELVNSLRDIANVSVPRCHKPKGFGVVVRYELHCFSDASKDAIGHVIYLSCSNAHSQVSLAFVYGSTKVSPRCADTIPRLELCAAMDAAQSVAKVKKEIGVDICDTRYYTDSLVVIGYLTNTTKRFSRYVSRRVEEVLKLTNVAQWSHISGANNVGDIATRPHTPSELMASDWFIGPEFLRTASPLTPPDDPPVDLPETVRVTTLKTQSLIVSQSNFLDKVTHYTNSWSKAIRIVSHLIQLCRLLSKKGKYEDVSCASRARELLIKHAQRKFANQILTIQRKGDLPEGDPLAGLSPLVDEAGVLRVGGRLKNSNFPADQKHPILLPSDHQVTQMIVSYYHESVSHQGRVLTHGAIRSAGYHVFHGSKVIRNHIHNCIFCRKLRGKTFAQIMSDLPSDRLETIAAFTHVGLDMFGPYLTYEGRSTRRTNATKKTWVLLITCLASRATHVEVVTTMDTAGFKLALRRFFAVRGTCVSIRSDQGSNFLGALSQSVDLNKVKGMVLDQGITWKLNPPLASNFGGVWERKVGAIKSVLNATMKLLGPRQLSREEFSTLLLEATSIVNNTPLWCVSGSPDDPCPLSPANLLTLKDNPNPPSLDSFDELDLLQYGTRRWRRVLYLAEQFWSRWRQNYIAELQERKKWRAANSKIGVGDVVLLRGKAKRNDWPGGRIVEVTPSEDGVIRRVKVQMGSRDGRPPLVLERCVRDVVVLVPN